MTRSIPGSINNESRAIPSRNRTATSYYDRATQNVETLRVYEEADVITCPNCGTQNEPGSPTSAKVRRQSWFADLRPPPPTHPSSPIQPVDGRAPVWVPGRGWVTDAERHRPGLLNRRPRTANPPKWLWVLLMAIALVDRAVLRQSSVYFNTSRGTDQLNRLGTWSAEHK